MAATSGSFDFCRALSGLSTEDSGVGRAGRDGNGGRDSSSSMIKKESQAAGMDEEKFNEMSVKVHKIFRLLDRASAFRTDVGGAASKENQDSSTTSPEAYFFPAFSCKPEFEEWSVSRLPSHQDIYLSRVAKQPASKKQFRSLPAGVVVDLEKEVLEHRRRYMETCTGQYWQLYQPCDCCNVNVSEVVQCLVELLVRRLEQENWDTAAPYRDSAYRSELHAVRALAVHFSLCTRSQVRSIISLLNLPYIAENSLTLELQNLLLYWVADPTFGPTVAELIGEAVLDGGDRIYSFLVEPIAERICPQRKPLSKYKNVRDTLVFHLCAALAKPHSKRNNCDIIRCLVKLDGYESWVFVEDTFISGDYDWDFDGYTYVDYLEDLNLPLSEDIEAPRKARHEPLHGGKAARKFWQDYDKRCLRLEERHKELRADPDYLGLRRVKMEASKMMSVRVAEFLWEKWGSGRLTNNGVPCHWLDEFKKWEADEERYSKVSGKEPLVSTCEKNGSNTPMSETLRPGKVPQKKCRVRECGFCGRQSTPEERFAKCGSCRLLYYCSRDCQKQHWRAGHRKWCCKK